VGPAQWCLSCVRAQTRFSCKKLRKTLADRPGSGGKRRFRPQQFAQRKCASSGLSTLRHPNHLEALSTAIAFPQSGRRLPALHKKLRHQQLTEWAELQNDLVTYAVGIENLPTVSSPCSWPTKATHAVMRSMLIDDWIMEILSRHGDWLRVTNDSWKFSLYQLVGHSVKSKPPTLAASPAVLPHFFHKSTLPRIRDANNNRLVTKYAIHLYVNTGGVRLFDRFLVSDNLSVPCILGTEFIKQNMQAILPLFRKIFWQEHVRCTEELPWPTPILACLNDNAWDRHWQDEPTRVRPCKQVRVNGHQEEWIIAICDTPGMVTITPNARLGQHKSMAVAHGLAIVKPDEPFLVKLCNFGEDQVIVRWNSTLGFAEPYQGPMLFAVLDEKSPKDGVDHSSAGTSRDPLEDLDLSEASEYLHKHIRNMLKTHSSMWDGALGVIRATEHAIVTPPDALPIRAQPYRTGPSKRQIMSDQINKMLKLNVIARSHSAWASPAEIVPKKNGEARFCVDYRRLNNFTKKDAYPLPRMEDCLDSLGDA